MARVVAQSPQQKSAFLGRIHAKEIIKEQQVQARVEAATPKILRFAFKPLASLWVRTASRETEGNWPLAESSGPDSRIRGSVNDVVIEYEPDDYAQIDHVAVGPRGILLIETKAWDGAILLKNDRCFRKGDHGSR